MTLEETLSKLLAIRKSNYFACLVITLLRWALFSTFLAGMWLVIRPSAHFEGFLLGLTSLMVCLLLDQLPSYQKITHKDLLLGLDINYPQITPSIYFFAENSDNPSAQVWQEPLNEIIEQNRSNEQKILKRYLSTLVIPIIINVVTIVPAGSVVEAFISNAIHVVNALHKKATLTIVQGQTDESLPKEYILSEKKTSEVNLIMPNLIKLELMTRTSESAPIVILRPLEDHTNQAIFQSFQMKEQIPSENEKNESVKNKYEISFSVTQNVKIVIPTLAGEKSLANVTVKHLPTPEVSLASVGKLEEPWPDDKELKLDIQVTAKNPLKLVRLVIKVGNRETRELVNTVSDHELKEFATTYDLLLEPYVDSDMAEVEIIAEAIDQAVPSPLVGQSAPLRVRTASAYGRYRQALNTLYELKKQLDHSIEAKEASLPTEASQLAQKASEQAEKTPFFDGLDRIQITSIQQMIAEHQNLPSLSGIYEISHTLNMFLEEHEILDDRERDRDFFVAARGISRLIDEPQKNASASVSAVADRIINFLTERRQRWKIRTSYVQNKEDLPSWEHIENDKPFQTNMEKIKELSKDSSVENRQKALTSLSQTVADYRAWLEELETAEDKARQQREKERQQGLADARNELKKIQKLQNSISAALDRAAFREQTELEDSWPATRMKENTNIEETSRLERKMRLLAPGAASRLNAALQAMNLTKENGNTANFAKAETFSDLASRLLRQAEKSSEGQEQNRRKRRRVTGDQYYGQAIHGGDVEINREYQVDKRYREDILDEVQSADYDEANKELLDNYLRRIIR